VSRLCLRSDRLRRTDAARATSWGPDLFGQGIVLSANKTARPSLRAFVPSSTVVPALNAFGLFARGCRRPLRGRRGSRSHKRLHPIHRRFERLRLRRGGRIGRRVDLSVRRMRHASSVGPSTRLRGPMSRIRRSPTHEPTRTKLLPLTPTNAIERAGSSTTYTMAMSSSSPSQVGGRGRIGPSAATAELAVAVSPEPKATDNARAAKCRIRFHFGTGQLT
jgi:hypothetical protein